MQLEHDRNGSALREQNAPDKSSMPSGASSASLPRLGLACILTMLAVGTVFMNQAVFPDIAGSFHVDAQEARLSFSVISLCYSLAFFFVGPVADSFDHRKIAAGGCALIATLLMIAMGLREYPWYLACTGLVGLAAATVPASMFPYVSRLASPRESGVYIGAVVASSTLGIVAGRAALGAFTGFIGWRGAYGLFSLIFALLAVLSAGGLGTTPGKWRKNKNIVKSYSEMVKMVMRPATASLLLTGFFLFFGFLGTITFLTYRLASPPFSFSAAEVGYISFAGLVAIVAPFSGGLSRRFGTYTIVFPSLLVCLGAMPILCWSRTVFWAASGMLLLFLGVYACQPLLFLLLGRRISSTALGSASSLYILFCIGGGSVASLVLGGVWKECGWTGVVLACSLSITVALGLAVVDFLKRASIRS